MDWPLDFTGELRRRLRLEKAVGASPHLIAAAIEMYRADPVMFVNDCVFVYEPRNASRGDPTRIPAVPFQRQAEFIAWMKDRFETKTSAPVEKSRDSGATWMAAAFATWLWLFHPGSVTGFGSRKEILVDRQGDMQAIFPKIRSIIEHLPWYLVPKGWSPKVHSNYMRIINPENDAAIVGEAGDNIGRGGRSSIYFVDEAAYIAHPELLEAALTANTDCRIDISSPRVGTLFNTWCATESNKFIFDVSDAPWHTPKWMATKKTELEAKGLGHVYRQEYLRDATAGIAGQLIPSDWVEAAVGAAQKLGIVPTGARMAALDVADGGADRNALAIRHGIEVFYCKSRLDLLADAAGNWAYFEALENNCQRLRYDSIGVGAGAAAALRDKKVVKVQGWAGSGAVVDPERLYDKTTGRTNADMFANAKAQAWWGLRTRFLRTYQVVVEGKSGIDPDSLISLAPDVAELRELKSELSQVTYKANEAGKVLINKTPEGHQSPNRADSVMMAYAPQPAGISIIGVF